MIKSIGKKPISNLILICSIIMGLQNSVMAEEAGNRVFFRGGSANLVEDRAGSGFTDFFGLGTSNSDDSGWYMGTGFDFFLSKDTLGLLPGTWALAEFAMEFRQISSERTILLGPTAACALAAGVTTVAGIVGAGCAITGEQDLLMLTVSASPKLKFNEGGKLRPWIIPIGVDMNVISPPSDSANYLDIGLQFGAGVDYMLYPGITVGIDARYHWAADLTDPELSGTAQALFNTVGATVDTDQDNDAWTIGASFGISF